MKLSFFSFLLMGLFVLSACDNDSDVMTDADLILAIQTANNKQTVTAAALPTDASNVLADDFSESYVDEAKLAPELGYEVGMRRGEGVLMGERNRIYFDLNGRVLRGDGDRDRERRRGEEGSDRRECFRLVFPVTFIMPDGTEITGDSEEEVGMAMREWYANNPGVEEGPELQYPVDIMFEDLSTLTVNSNEEMRAAYENCE